MATHPSQRWENGVLVERAIAVSGNDGEKEELPSVTGRPNDVAGANSTFAERAAASDAEAKNVDASAAENRAVKAPRTRKK